MAMSFATLLTGVYQAERRFTWPAIVPAIGALITLALVLSLVGRVGVLGAALAMTVGMVVQAVLLAPILRHAGARVGPATWRHPGVIAVLHLLWPVLAGGLLTRWTPVVDRYIASGMESGSISHLSYAFRLTGLLSMLLATGVTTVLYPRMAGAFAGSDDRHFHGTVARGIAYLWLLAAPAVALIFALAEPAIALVFERGAFTPADTAAVASVLRVYALALPSMCLGTITGRVFYARRQTGVLAAAGVIEALAYVAYAPLLARRFGIDGIAAAYVIYFSVSVVWHMIFLRVSAGMRGGRSLLSSLARSGAAAVMAGVAAYGAASLADLAAVRVVLGMIAGAGAFIIVLTVVRSPELDLVRRTVTDGIRA
jgi:putative peptidoglycan lipid II flippase